MRFKQCFAKRISWNYHRKNSNSIEESLDASSTNMASGKNKQGAKKATYCRMQPSASNIATNKQRSISMFFEMFLIFTNSGFIDRIVNGCRQLISNIGVLLSQDIVYNSWSCFLVGIKSSIPVSFLFKKY